MCHEFNGYFLQTSLTIVCDLLVPTPAAMKSIGIIKERATYTTMCVGPSLSVVLLSTHIAILRDLHNCGMAMISDIEVSIGRKIQLSSIIISALCQN